MATYDIKRVWFCTKETFKYINTLIQDLTKLNNVVWIGAANCDGDNRYIESNIKRLAKKLI